MSLINYGTSLISTGVVSKSSDIGNFISPISNVSTQPVQVGTTYSKTVSAGFLKPLEIAVSNIFGTQTFAIPKINLTTPSAKSTSVLVTESSGSKGNIWDILGRSAEKILDTGLNVLQQKYGQPKVTTTAQPVKQSIGTSPETIFNPTNSIQGALSKLLGDAFNPAISTGIKSGITNTANQMTTWVIIAVIVIILFVVLSKAR